MFRYMNYAYAVYKEKSFTKAAEKLYISQPSLSLTIKKLEETLGAPIFERFGKEVTLTSVGEKYIAAAEEIMRIKNDFQNELDDMLDLKKGKITVGSTVFVSSCILPGILARFREKYPYIRTEIVVESSTVLRKMLDAGELDVVIDNMLSASDEYGLIPVLKEKILLGVPCGFEINKRHGNKQIPEADIKNDSCRTAPQINISELCGERFILLKSGNKMREITDSIFAEADVLPEDTMEFDQLMTSLSYAESGFGICFLTDTILKYTKGCTGLCYYIPETRYAERTLYIIYKKSKYLSRAAKAFADEVYV